MNYAVIVVLALLVGYVVIEVMGPFNHLKEGFAVAKRADIGYAADGWGEDNGYERDLRYTETYVDIQGLGVASDFCRAVRRKVDPDSLRISCALGRRDGMDTMEYNTRTKGEGFRFSRDDYWRQSTSNSGGKSQRMDYCRILKDTTGEWFSSCAIAGLDGFKRQEERDSTPPPAINALLDAYDGVLVWYRWQDDREDYAQHAAFTAYGNPVFPTDLKPVVSRGLQLNRWSIAAQEAGEPAPPLKDYLRWGEAGTYELHAAIQPRQIRAIAFWIWWDGFEKGATVLECSNPSMDGLKKDKIILGIDGGGPDLPPMAPTPPAREVRTEVIQAIGQLTEPANVRRPRSPLPLSKSATYYFEIWDESQRIMRLTAPMSAAKAGEWQHVAITVTDATAWWPTWQLWLNGSVVAEKTDGRLSPALEIKDNYIGKNVRGCIQDFRMYRVPLTAEKLKATMKYAESKLHPMP